MAGKVIDLRGEQFGRLSVTHRAAGNPPRWWCRCECGEKKAILGAHLRNGVIQSCGCLRRERASARGKARAEEISQQATTHGLSQHPLYRVWAGIVRRCENPNERSYRWYGARGVYMCLEWRRNPELFFQWAMAEGWQKGLVLARHGDTGPYSPANCKIITRIQNSSEAAARPRNRRKQKAASQLRAEYRAGRCVHPSTL